MDSKKNETKWAKGVSGNPAGRPKNSQNKILSKMEIDKSILSGATDAIDKLGKLLKDPEESVQLRAAIKISDEAYKIIKTEKVFQSYDIRFKFLTHFKAALVLLKTLSTTAEDSNIQIKASASILDKALDIMKVRDAERASKKFQDDLSSEGKKKVVPIVSMTAE